MPKLRRNRQDPSEDDFTEKRLEMVRAQIRERGITNPKVLHAMEQVPRHLFVAKHDIAKAYADFAQPIAANQTISQPYIVALMAQAAEISPNDRVLEIGCGSGYGAAVLSHLSAEVVSVERKPQLAATASNLLTELGYSNVEVVVADGSLGHTPRAPYAAILVTASAPKIPTALLQQLQEGGRLIVPLGEQGKTQHLTRVRKQQGQPISTEVLCNVRFVPLITPKPN